MHTCLIRDAACRLAPFSLQDDTFSAANTVSSITNEIYGREACEAKYIVMYTYPWRAWMPCCDCLPVLQVLLMMMQAQGPEPRCSNDVALGVLRALQPVLQLF